MSGLKALHCTMQHWLLQRAISNPPALTTAATMPSPRRGQQQDRLAQSLPAWGPEDTAVTDRCRWGSGLFRSLLLWACSWDATAAMPAWLPQRRQLPGHLRPRLRADISCLWFNLPATRLPGLQLGFLPLPRETSALLQWAHGCATRWLCWSHQWLTEHSPPRARSRSQTLQWGCPLVSWHGDTCSPWPWLTCRTTKLFLHLNCSTGVSGLNSKIQGMLQAIMQGRRPTQFHVFSSTGRRGRESKRKAGWICFSSY